MSKKAKGRADRIASRVKRTIVTVALWGWLPIGLVDWIIRLEGVSDA
ncbi:MAG: hypothetical protein HZB29_07490 [Nitrospinae bacterium]|nr:hypothetical protein [Nitrospinota bacterium]